MNEIMMILRKKVVVGKKHLGSIFHSLDDFRSLYSPTYCP